MAKKVDQFRSSVGRLVEGKPITRKGVRTRRKLDKRDDKYWDANKQKFRKYGKVNGVMVALPKNTFVEKKKYRKDKPLERLPPKRRKFTI